MNRKKQLVLEHYNLKEVKVVDYRKPMVSVDYSHDSINNKNVIDVAVSLGANHVDHQFFGAIHNALHSMQGHIMYEPGLEYYFIAEEFQEESEKLWERLYEHIKPENFSELSNALK